jgi:hypothetical protein
MSPNQSTKTSAGVSTEIAYPGIIAIGLSFSRVGGYNIVAASASEQYSRVAYGMTVLLFYVGMP